MEITIETVTHLASLSALEFSEEEKKVFVKDFKSRLEMISQIQKAVTDDNMIFGRSHKLSELRGDETKESLPQEEILENAPKQRRGCFVVPLVVE